MLDGLVSAIERLVHLSISTVAGHGQLSKPDAISPSGAQAELAPSGNADARVQEQQQQSQGSRQQQVLLPSVPSALPPHRLLQAFGADGQWDSRLQLLQAQPCQGLQERTDQGPDCSPTFWAVELTALSAPLHGVIGAEVNAALMLALNRTGRVFAFGSRTAGAISAATLVQQADRWVFSCDLKFLPIHACMNAPLVVRSPPPTDLVYSVISGVRC